MRKLFCLLSLLCAIAVHGQQYMRLWKGAESTRLQQEDVTFSNSGTTISVGGQSYATSTVDSITIVKTIFITWNGASASVVIPESAKDEVVATTSGSHVTITNNNVFQEMEFVLSGTSNDGSLTYNGQYKGKFHLNGLNLTSAIGGALNIQCGKRIDLILADGTSNTLTDAANGTHKAALYCKGHLEVSGSGSLRVAGNTKHAIQTKEYLLLKNSCGPITIAKATSDAFHVGQYFMMNDGSITIDDNTLGDGIQVDATEDPADELNGQAFVKGGKIQITIASQDCKGIKTSASETLTGSVIVPAGDITISGGTINIIAKGGGSRGIQTDANVTITADDSAPSVTINATGGRCTLPDCVYDPHRCVGIKVGKTFTTTGGLTIVSNTGSKSRAVQCTAFSTAPGTYDGGEIVVK